MKQTELKPCGICKKPLMHTGLPLFWKLSAQRFAVNVAAARRQAGLEQMLGSAQLAQAMGPNEDMAISIAASSEFLLCESCMFDTCGSLVAAIEELQAKAEERA